MHDEHDFRFVRNYKFCHTLLRMTILSSIEIARAESGVNETSFGFDGSSFHPSESDGDR